MVQEFANRAKQVFCASSDPIDVVVVSSLLSGKGKWSSDSRGGCFLRLMQQIFNETAMQASTWANKLGAKAIRASHGP